MFLTAFFIFPLTSIHTNRIVRGVIAAETASAICESSLITLFDAS